MVNGTFGQRDPGARTGDEALTVDVDLELPFYDVKGLILSTVGVWRRPGLRRYQYLDQGESADGIVSAGLDRVVVADGPDRSVFTRVQKAAIHGSSPRTGAAMDYYESIPLLPWINCHCSPPPQDV